MDAKRGAWWRRVAESVFDYDDDFQYYDSLVHKFTIQARMQELLHEDQMDPRQHEGSCPKTLKQKRRRAEDVDKQLFQDYFEPTGSVFSKKDFCRWFRMSKRLFSKLVDEVCEYDSYFIKKMLLENWN